MFELKEAHAKSGSMLREVCTEIAWSRRSRGDSNRLWYDGGRERSELDPKSLKRWPRVSDAQAIFGGCHQDMPWPAHPREPLERRWTPLWRCSGGARAPLGRNSGATGAPLCLGRRHQHSRHLLQSPRANAFAPTSCDTARRGNMIDFVVVGVVSCNESSVVFVCVSRAFGREQTKPNGKTRGL